MATSKILIDGVGIDLTSDTVSANRLEQGYTAHNSNGDIITGTLVPGITPSGTKTITENGTTDVTNYANADVQVPIIVNDNWLDNWYMGDPVNQRGQTAYSGAAGYCIDRWRRDAPITVDIVTDGVTVTNTGSGGYVFWQYLTNKLTIGVPYTISILYSTSYTGDDWPLMRLHDESAIFNSVSFRPSLTKALVTSTYTHTGSNQISRIQVRPANGKDVTIYGIKIEQGNKQTLAHQESGEWVLNEIPNKDAQLLLCQTSTADASDGYANKVVAASGTVSITTNGTHNIAQYEKATVNVQSSWPPATITAGDTPVMCNPSSYTNSTKNYEDSGISLTITKAGTYRFKWDLVGNRNGSGTNLTAYSKLYVNGVAQGTEKSISGTGVSVVSQDLTVNVGDVVSIWLKMANTTYTGKVSMLVACINGDNGF